MAAISRTENKVYSVQQKVKKQQLTLIDICKKWIRLHVLQYVELDYILIKCINLGYLISENTKILISMILHFFNFVFILNYPFRNLKSKFHFITQHNYFMNTMTIKMK